MDAIDSDAIDGVRGPIFDDRADAGRRLAQRLEHLRGGCVVVGLPRGGVVVAAEVARALDVPLDVIVVRKLGVPFQPELAMGAIGEGGVRVVNADIVRRAGVSERDIATIETRERHEVVRRVRRFRGDRRPLSLVGHTVVIVDDGIATGSTALAACDVVRAQGADRVVLAVPLAPPGWTRWFGDAADEYVCLATPSPFDAIGPWYRDFTQTTDDEVVAALDEAVRRGGRVERATGRPAIDEPIDEDVEISRGAVRLPGRLTVPAGARGVVLFAHGSGSSRTSPRNRYVAEVLQRGGLGTLLFDLLSPSEAQHREHVFDVDLLGRRLLLATEWLRARPEVAELPVAYFGASTGAAAAIDAAAQPGADVAAVVSRGGRPDLAPDQLGRVTAPTLLVVGGDDTAVLDLNRRALARLRCEARLEVVPGATHLFEEPGTLEAVARLARDWIVDHLPPP
jgi:putative phosphoribosyl transferase